jgi:hypothetical protein
MTFFTDDPFQGLLALSALLAVVRKKDQAAPVFPRPWKGKPGFTRHTVEKPVRQLYQDPGAVAGVGLAAARSPVHQVLQHRERLLHNGTRNSPLNVHHKAHAARVVFLCRII